MAQHAMRLVFHRLPGTPGVPAHEFHIRRAARDAHRFADSLFSARGDVLFANLREAHRIAEEMNATNSVAPPLRPAELHAMGVIHEVLHGVLSLYRRTVRPQLYTEMLEKLGLQLGGALDRTLLAFVEEFPPPTVYRGEQSASAFLAGSTDGVAHREWIFEELLLLYVSNQNPGYAPIESLISDAGLRASTAYLDLITAAGEIFDSAPRFGPDRQPILEMLLAPSRSAPDSLFQQLEFMRARWGVELGELDALLKILFGLDLIREESAWFQRKTNFQPGAESLPPAQYSGELYVHEPEQFSADLDWMPRVVMIAKSTFVWLDQLSRKYARAVETLADIPEEELRSLAARGLTGLWLIGIWKRSAASQRVKQMQGNAGALASAYSLHDYEIAPELGGEAALKILEQRAHKFGLRLASDMVPNHMGLDSRWVNQHPDWFIQTREPPFPGYRFSGADLGSDPNIFIQIEDGYWSKTDAAVVFKRYDKRDGDTRYVYHGNDGTSMPWNDTAQLDYLKAEVREASIQTILHVARKFPIIRFDAAMTLAKRHLQRLWYPLPGSGGAIPSRAEYAMSRERFEALIPEEFWREVVDRVAAEAPNTLLLAEAFWMMEGYFVRTLGMHRVYNSAFMNMLKKEENGNYRLTIRNVLEFNPQILKRFVNFMNNPDEEPAIAQFGDGDKYFGVCILLATMPGLPMFGHGQIEGFHEKYGMEYARAQWNETPNEGLIARHEHDIFPVLKKRYLFSEVEHFYLYDYVAESGAVDEDVFVYSNRAGAEQALIVYHNKYKETRGRVRTSVGFLDQGAIAVRPLAETLALTVAPGVVVIMRDHIRGLDYLCRTEELAEHGLPLALRAFEYRVLWKFREVVDTKRRPWLALARRLDGGGVSSADEALIDEAYRAVHRPLFEAVNAGSARYLAAADPPARAVAVEEKLQHLLDGLLWMAKEGIFAGEEALKTELPLPRALVEETGARIHKNSTQLEVATIFTEAAALLAAGIAPLETPDSWRWSRPLIEAGIDAAAAELTALLLTFEPGDYLEDLLSTLADPAIKKFLHVHEHGGTVWFNRENFEALVEALARRHTTALEAGDPQEAAEKAIRAATESAYQFPALIEILSPAKE